MAKHSYEFKKQLVLEYLDNQGSYASISQWHVGQLPVKKMGCCLQKNGGCRVKTLSLPERILFRRKAFCGRVLLNKRTLVSGTGSSNGKQQSVDACQMGK